MTEGLSSGTDIQFLSVYPKEQEQLYPPLTRIKLEEFAIISERDLAKIEKDLEPLDKIKEELEKLAMGAEIKNSELADALQRKVDFDQEEWDEFKVAELSCFSHIKVGDKYFTPAAVSSSENSGTRTQGLMWKEVESTKLNEELNMLQEKLNAARAKCGLFERAKKEAEKSAQADGVRICKMSVQLS